MSVYDAIWYYSYYNRGTSYLELKKYELAIADFDTAITINDSGADVDFRVESENDANCLIVDGATDRVTIGLPPGLAENSGGSIWKFQIEGTDNATSGMSLTRNSNNALSPKLNFTKTRGGAVNADTAVQDDDVCGELLFNLTTNSKLY